MWPLARRTWGFAPAKIRENVDASLKSVHMEAYREASPNKLSGGQKQRVAVAGILAMEPECIILDEPTAMLDPSGRREVMETIEYLNREKKMTIIYITHHNGRSRAGGSDCRDGPWPCGDERKASSGIYAGGSDEGTRPGLCPRPRNWPGGCVSEASMVPQGYYDDGGDDRSPMPIEVKDVSYLYEAGTPFEKEALSHVSLTIEQESSSA